MPEREKSHQSLILCRHSQSGRNGVILEKDYSVTAAEKFFSFDYYEHIRKLYGPNRMASFFLTSELTFASGCIMEPFRNFFYWISLFYEDGGIVRVGGSEHVIKKGSLLVISPGMVIQWVGEQNPSQHTLLFTEEVFEKGFNSTLLQSLPFFTPGGGYMIDLSDNGYEQMKILCQTLTGFKEEPALVPGILHSMLMLLDKEHRQWLHQDTRQPSAKQQLIQRFSTLLSKNFLREKEINFYAKELNLSAKYLSEVLLAETGRSAKKWIDDQVMLEAKSLLLQTDMTIKEINYWLGFEDPSYFNRVFRKREGMTPLEYRADRRSGDRS